MPQMQLPIFPAGFTAINNEIGFQEQDGKVAYFNGHLPVFQHDTGDVQSFRLYTSQLIVQGTPSQTDIVKAFGAPLITVKRYVKVLREEGSKGFFSARKRRSAPVLTPAMLGRVQALLDEGKGVPEIAKETQVLPAPRLQFVGRSDRRCPPPTYVTAFPKRPDPLRPLAHDPKSARSADPSRASSLRAEREQP